VIIIDSVGTNNASGLVGAPAFLVGDMFERIKSAGTKWVDEGVFARAVGRKAMQIQNSKETYHSAHRSCSPQVDGN
jgi:hypothetical protein